jgi:Pin2-interacting protein X1
MASQLYSKKTIEKMGSVLKESSGSKVSSFAMRQMEKMGWKEGTGLGKNADGRVVHVKTTKKDDKDGLGASAETKGEAAGEDQWWFDSYSNGMSEFKKEARKKRKRGDDEDNSGSDDREKKSKKSKKDKKDKKDKKKDKKEKKSEKKSKDKSDKKDFSAPSFEELFKATGGARLGMRARANQAGKFKRTETI